MTDLIARLRHMAKLCAYGGLNDLLNEAAEALAARPSPDEAKGDGLMDQVPREDIEHRMGWASMSAVEVACYKWPDDTPEHKAARRAYAEGAMHTVLREQK